MSNKSGRPAPHAVGTAKPEAGAGNAPAGMFRPRGGPGHGTALRPVEKARDFKRTFKRLAGYLAPQKMKFLAVGLLAVVSTVFSIFGPKILGMATTRIVEGVMAPVPFFDTGYIGRILLLMVILYAVSFLTGYAMAYIMSGVSQKTVYVLRNEVKEKLDRLPLKYFDRRTHGEILSRVTNDMDTIATTLQQSLTQIITSVITLVGILIMMLSISPALTVIALVTIPVCAALTAVIAKKSRKYFSEQQKILGRLNGHVEEMYAGHRIVKAFGQEEDSISRFREINAELYHVGWKAQFISGIIMPVLNFVNNLGYVFICIIGGLLAAKRAVDVGDIQAFIQYIRGFTHPIIQTANIANVIQGAIAGAERVFEVLDEEEQTPDPVMTAPDTEGRKPDPVAVPAADGHPLASKEQAPAPEGRPAGTDHWQPAKSRAAADGTGRNNVCGEVAFKHVSFRYLENVPLIEDMNIHVKPGQMAAIVGPTGAGKTTLVNLLLRFYEVNGGRITVDGVDIAKMPRSDLRSLFGMVLQDAWLFKGTVMENIGYGLEGADRGKIIGAAKAAHADHFIRSLPMGYDTVLNEEASNISQGQKQLLTIARAFLADPPILILDEATSSVDTRTEALVQKGMAGLMKGRTSFVIAHRLSTIKNADLILVMKDGSFVEQGTHEELIRQKGFYADLYNSQFTTNPDVQEGNNE